MNTILGLVLAGLVFAILNEWSKKGKRGTVTAPAPADQTGTDVIDYQAPDGGTELDQVG